MASVPETTAPVAVAPADDGYAVAADNWQRYCYGVERGHRAYTYQAELLEGFYLGGLYNRDGLLLPGGQWNADDLAILNEQGRPAYEVNAIKPAIDAATGYQIANRMDISFRPRSGESTKEVADVRSKVAMQIADNNQLHWKETEVFADGMIEQRGYFDARMCFDDSILGELRITVLDPRDVIPDPDAKAYDPDHWSDVIITRWLTFDEIEGLYGIEARQIAEDAHPNSTVANAEDFGDDLDGARRNKFGSENNHDSAYSLGNVQHIRIIDRQKWVRNVMQVSISPEGDVRPLSGDETPEFMQNLIEHGSHVTKRIAKRVRWQVSTHGALLHDDWSPYDRLTVVPFFPFFRRGKTRGMVDNAVGPQKVLDKAISKAIEIINTTANSGWQLEQGQLTNMSTSDLETRGASTGLILERKQGTQPLAKIISNPMPQGFEKMIEITSQCIKDVTVPDAMRGIAEPNEAGITNQSRQHAAQQILSVPLDNLARTRHMLASWIDYAISKYMDTARVLRITKTDPMTGKDIEDRVPINQPQGDGTYLNDMTAGEYDVVIAEQPMQITFDNSQFTQMMEMRKEGIRIPDTAVVKHSNITDKQDIITAMEGAAAPADPLAEAKAALLAVQAEKTKAETVAKNVEGQFSAVETAQAIAALPELAPMADQLLKSAGGVDADQPPIVGGPPGNQAVTVPQPAPGEPIAQASPLSVPPPAVRQNTSPLFPPRVASPAAGMNTGIEGGT